MIRSERAASATGPLDQSPRSIPWNPLLLLTLSALSLCLFFPILRQVYWPRADGMDIAGYQIGRDFINLWAAPQIAFTQAPGTIFDLDRYNELISSLFGAPIPFHMWSYPPVVLLLAWPIAQLPYAFALVCWTILGFGAFAAITASELPRPRVAIGLIALALAPASLINTVGGQNGFITGALLLGALLALDRRPVLSGVLFGLLTIKPQLGLVVPFVLLALGAWRTIASAAATAIALYGTSLILFGVDFWHAYITYTTEIQASVVYAPGKFWSSMMMAPMAGFMALGASSTTALIGQSVVSATVIVLTMMAVRSTPDRLIRALVVVSAVPLVPHQIFNYDLPVLAAAWLIVLLDPRFHYTPHVSLVACLVWLSPFLVMFGYFLKVPAVSQLILGAGFIASLAVAHQNAPAPLRA